MTENVRSCCGASYPDDHNEGCVMKKLEMVMTKTLDKSEKSPEEQELIQEQTIAVVEEAMKVGIENDLRQIHNETEHGAEKLTPVRSNMQEEEVGSHVLNMLYKIYPDAADTPIITKKCKDWYNIELDPVQLGIVLARLKIEQHILDTHSPKTCIGGCGCPVGDKYRIWTNGMKCVELQEWIPKLGVIPPTTRSVECPKCHAQTTDVRPTSSDKWSAKCSNEQCGIKWKAVMKI